MSAKRGKRKQHKAVVEFDRLARNRIGKIRGISFSMENKEIRHQFEAICSLAGDILQLVHDKPDTLNGVQSIVLKYLDTLYQLSQKYGKLVSLPNKDRDVTDLLAKSEKAVTEIQHFLEGIQTRLMSDDLLDLDIQLSVLETELEMDKLQDYFP